MDLEASYTINLEDYGMQGTISMASPSFRRMIEMKNAISRSARLVKGRGDDVSVQDVPQGDLEIFSILAYVESAPFAKTKDGFLAYCDKMDANRKGSAEKLFDEMSDLVMKIDKGDDSPFVDSAEAETESLE